MTLSRTLFVIVAVLGLSALSVGIYLGVSRQMFLAKCDRVEGKIIDYQRQSRSGGRPRGGSSTRHVPIVAYEVANQTYRVTGTVGFKSRDGKGEARTVAYLPNNPEEATIDSFVESWFACLLVSIIGTVLSTIGILGGLKSRVRPSTSINAVPSSLRSG